MKKTKKMQVTREVTETANYFLEGYVYNTAEVEGGLYVHVEHPFTDSYMLVEFQKDATLKSGYRFYSPLTRQNWSEITWYYFQACKIELPESERRNLEKALHDWAFKWKTGAFTGSGYTRPKFGNARHRRCYRLKSKEFTPVEEGEVYELN